MVCVADELLSRLREACPHLSGGFRAYLASGKAPIIKLVSSQAKSVVVHAEVCICPSSVSLLGFVSTIFPLNDTGGGQVFKLTPGLNLLEVRHKLGSQAQFTEVSMPIADLFAHSNHLCC